MRIQLSSRFLLLAGYLQLQVTLPSVAQHIRLDDIQVTLSEHVTLISKEKPGSKEKKPPIIHQVLSVMESQSKQAANLEPGTSYETREQFRLPIFAVRAIFRLSARFHQANATCTPIAHLCKHSRRL